MRTPTKLFLGAVGLLAVTGAAAAASGSRLLGQVAGVFLLAAGVTGLLFGVDLFRRLFALDGSPPGGNLPPDGRNSGETATGAEPIGTPDGDGPPTTGAGTEPGENQGSSSEQDTPGDDVREDGPGDDEDPDAPGGEAGDR